MSDRTVTAFLKANIADFQRGMVAASATTKAFTKELDTSTNRGVNLTQSLLAIGPALVPIGAAAVPAISGLTNQLGFAAAGAGVTALAFTGLGDALKATNEYAIEPSAANFEKMQQSLSELGPAGREFTAFLQQIRPELQRLQDSAQEGLLPGAEAGIRDLMDLMPQAERIVSTVATTLGDLIAESGRNLSSPQWAEFFDFLETEARPTLLDMGRTLGNFAEGFTNLWMAFDPLSDRFSASFLQLSRDFAVWTDGLDQTEGFQEFLAYVSRVGPQVWDTLGALSNALLQVVEAAAPVGEASLPVIRALADVLATIADSPVGPVLIGTAAGISAISRAVALYKLANGSAITRLLGVSGDKGAQAGIGLRAAAAGAGIFALSMTDIDEKLRLTNTATFALLGTAALPGLGTALGAVAGLAMDFAAANDTLTDAMKRAGSAVGDNSVSIQEQATSLKAVRAAIKAGDNDGLLGVSDFDSKIAKAELQVLQAQYEQNKASAQSLRFEEVGLGDSMSHASQATRDQTEALLDNIEKHNTLTGKLLGERDGMRGFEQAIDDATESLKENGRTLDIGTEKGRNNQAALDQVVASFNDLTVEQQSNVDTQERARNAFVDTAVAMGMARADARKLAKQLLEIPTDIRTKVNADTVAALNKLRGLQEYINGMNGKTLKINIEGGTPGGITTHSAAGNIFAAYAGGGMESHMPQIGDGMVSRVWNEPETKGEAYIPLADDWRRPRAEEIWRETGRLLGMHSGRVQRFADGGLSSTSAAFGPTFTIDYDRLAAAISREPVVVEAYVKMTDRDWSDGVQRGTRAGGRTQ